MYFNIFSSVSAVYKVCYDKTCSYFSSANVTDSKERLFNELSSLSQYWTFIDTPTHIIDNIFIGSAYNAANYNSLSENNFGLIINMTHDLSNHYTSEYIYKNFPINDNDEENIDIYLDTAYDYIEEYNKNTTKNILVHCYMGKSRSASIVIYYLIKKYNYTLDDAIKYIKDKRNIVNPNVNFVMQLKEHDCSSPV